MGGWVGGWMDEWKYKLLFTVNLCLEKAYVIYKLILHQFLATYKCVTCLCYVK